MSQAPCADCSSALPAGLLSWWYTKQQALDVVDALTDPRPHTAPEVCNGMVFQELQQSEQVIRCALYNLLDVCHELIYSIVQASDNQVT